MNPKRPLDDERLARLIGSVTAEADPAVLERAKARIAGLAAAGAAIEGWELALPAGLAWLFRPLALSGAAAACVVALAAGFWFGGASNGASGSGGSLLATSGETLPGALLDELDAGETPAADGMLRDSGGPS